MAGWAAAVLFQHALRQCAVVHRYQRVRHANQYHANGNFLKKQSKVAPRGARAGGLTTLARQLANPLTHAGRKKIP
jgi:hypothetical protein